MIGAAPARQRLPGAAMLRFGDWRSGIESRRQLHGCEAWPTLPCACRSEMPGVAR